MKESRKWPPGRRLVLVGVLVTAAALPLPWTAAGLFGRGSTTMFDMILSLAAYLSPGLAEQTGIGLILSEYLIVGLVLLEAAASYVTGLLLGAAAAFGRGTGRRAGVASYAAGAGWLFGIGLFVLVKAEAANTPPTSVMQAIQLAVSALLSAGYGPYLAIAGGLVLAVVAPAASRAKGRGFSAFLDRRVILLLAGMGSVKVKVVERDLTHAVIDVLGKSGRRTLVYCDYLKGGGTVPLKSLESFAFAVAEEVKAGRFGGGMYITNGKFAPGCADSENVRLVDGEKAARLLKAEGITSGR